MTTTEPAADFEASLRARNAAALRVEVALGALLVPSFWGLDWLTIPEHVWVTLGFRVGCTAYALAILAAGKLRPEWTARHVAGLSFSFSLSVAWSIALMCFMHEGYESPYYAGINLLILAVGLLFSWRTTTAIVFVAAVYLFYMAPLLLGLLAVRDGVTALGNQLFMVSTMIITVTSQYYRRRLERREFEAQVAQQQLLAEVQHMATTDWLTSLYNRRHFFRLGEDEIERARRYVHPISVLMVDIDHFKAINDTYGHSVGDQVLCAIAKRMIGGLRKSDIAGRYGGEEFAMVLPETDVHSATSIVAERMRESVCSRPVDTAEGPLHVTVSIGVAGVEGAKENLLDALTRADHGLYAAKREGRNRVVAWSPALADAGGQA
ncbi:MAG: GGDEF domain-containing protein [Myxococcales bacterium]|nr:GGDEF domain-containing protein [Myxococcales bacterium]